MMDRSKDRFAQGSLSLKGRGKDGFFKPQVERSSSSANGGTIL
jgi:hypothetical protein